METLHKYVIFLSSGLKELETVSEWQFGSSEASKEGSSEGSKFGVEVHGTKEGKKDELKK